MDAHTISTFAATAIAAGQGVAGHVGTWPAFLAAGTAIAPPPAGTFEPWTLNLFFWLGALVLGLTIFNQSRQAFGRQPALHVELERVNGKNSELRKELFEKLDGCLTNAAFEEHKRERAQDIMRLEKGLERLSEEIKEAGTANYNGRKALHKQVNAHGEALAWIAGGAGSRGQEIRRIVAKGNPDEGGQL